MILGESLISHEEEYNKPREKCAIAGFVSFQNENVAPYLYVELDNQQNRGQDGGGMVLVPKGSSQMLYHRGKGLISEAFAQLPTMIQHGFSAPVGIGHTRYATDKSVSADDPKGFGPFIVQHEGRSLGIAHNGQVGKEDIDRLRRSLPEGLSYKAGTDSELIGWKIITSPGQTWEQKMRNGLANIPGAYSLVMTTDTGELFGIRDPHSIRPLNIGYMDYGVAIVSETHGFKHLPINRWEEIKGGEMVRADTNGYITKKQLLVPQAQASRCVVEGLYFQHPHSKEREGGLENASIRRRLGRELAIEFPLPMILAHLQKKGITVKDPMNDVLIFGVPDGGIDFADGYARAHGRNVDSPLRRERYAVKRSFMAPGQRERIVVLDGKFSLSEELDGKIAIIEDDTGIRGNTDRTLNKAIKQMGALAVCNLKGGPKIINPCDMGVDIAQKSDLIAWDSEKNRARSDQEIAELVGSDFMGYISVDGMKRAFGHEDFCYQCMGGPHPLHN